MTVSKKGFILFAGASERASYTLPTFLPAIFNHNMLMLHVLAMAPFYTTPPHLNAYCVTFCCYYLSTYSL